MILVFAMDYHKTGNSGGWSRQAKHKPQPVCVSGLWDGLDWGTPEVRGKKRRKFTAFNLSTVPATLIRRDYALEDLRALGAAVPEFYFDELGNMRGKQDQLIFDGPRAIMP